VRVDQARQDGFAATIDRLCLWELASQLVRRANRGNPVPLNSDSGVAEDGAPRVAGDHGGIPDEQAHLGADGSRGRPRNILMMSAC